MQIARNDSFTVTPFINICRPMSIIKYNLASFSKYQLRPHLIEVCEEYFPDV